MLNVLTFIVTTGLPMKIDLFSFVQKGKRTISFMSQSMGLMAGKYRLTSNTCAPTKSNCAELDIGTDNLRWMGDTRFMVGLLRGRKFNGQHPVFRNLLLG